MRSKKKRKRFEFWADPSGRLVLAKIRTWHLFASNERSPDCGFAYPSLRKNYFNIWLYIVYL